MVKCDKCVPAMDRRNFLRFSLGAGAGLAAASMPYDLLAQQTVARQRAGSTARAVIWLWMGGGPSQLDTWDPKPGSRNQGEFKAIDSAVRGIQVSELLPISASQMKHMSIIRSMSTGEGAHERGTSLMHIGMSPIPGLDIPSTGTVISYERGDKKFPLPHFIAIDPPAIPQGSPWGDEYLPFRLANASNPIPNVSRQVDAERDRKRAALLLEQNKEWDAKRQQKEIEKVEKAYVKSEDVMNTPLLQAFDYQSDKSASQYKGRFATNCLLARRLVEAGCSFVEIGMGGWDTHNDNFNALRRMLPNLDNGMGTLVKDLAERDLMKEVMVVWAGEFGRTPEINNGKGRDHWASGFSVVMAGGPIQGGRVYGDTGKDGSGATKPVPVWDFFATLYKACGIDPNKKYDTEGRKIKYASINGNAQSTAKPIADLF